MCVVSQAEFNSNPAKYFDIAQRETVVIEGTDKIYELVMKIDKNDYISGDELKKKVFAHIEKMYESRKQVITEEDLKNSYSVEEFKTVMKDEIHQIFNRK